MPASLYMDVHVPLAVTEQLRRRNVDVLTAVEDGASELPDDELLSRATELGRLIVTFDVRFKAMAENWQHTDQPFGGLAYAHPMRVSIGQLVRDLEVIAKATDVEYWRDRIEVLPL
jgi:hypothetical protein